VVPKRKYLRRRTAAIHLGGGPCNGSLALDNREGKTHRRTRSLLVGAGAASLVDLTSRLAGDCLNTKTAAEPDTKPAPVVALRPWTK